jgi:transcriptional regulator
VCKPEKPSRPIPLGCEISLGARARADTSPVDFQQDVLLISNMSETNRTELLQGTLDLLVLKTLATLGALHGFGIARRIEQVSGDTVLLNQGTIYPALVRLEEQGWIESEWGVSENNRRARFYRITAAGRRQLKEEVANWDRVTALVNAVLAADS